MPKPIVPALLTAALLTGCGGGSGSVSVPADATAQAALEELGSVIKSAADQKQRPPGKPADLDKYEPIAMAGVSAVAQKKVVYLWGAGYKPGGTAVVAYAATAPDQGGPVLLEDGTVKEMTAAEFAAAPKAGKK
jgi:hypothetical protein